MSVSVSPASGVRPNVKQGMECRVYERHNCQVETVCQPVAARGPGEMTWEASIKDISVGGVGIICVRRFEPGTGLAVEIPSEDDFKDTLLARVAHATRLPSGKWLIGCSFISQLSDEEVLKLAAINKANNEAKEAKTETQVVEIPQVEISRVWWMNFETGKQRLAPKLKINSSWPLPRNSKLKIWLKEKNGAKPTTLIIRDCYQNGDDWVVWYSVVKD